MTALAVAQPRLPGRQDTGYRDAGAEFREPEVRDSVRPTWATPPSRYATIPSHRTAPSPQ
jgi:hypothetical protein